MIPSRKKESRAAESKPATRFTRRDWILLSTIVGLIVLPLAGMILYRVHADKSLFARSLDHQFDEWRTRYHLTAEQELRIRGIESITAAMASPHRIAPRKTGKGTTRKLLPR